MKFYEIYLPTKDNNSVIQNATSSIKVSGKELCAVPDDNGNYVRVDWPTSNEYLNSDVLDTLTGVNNEAYIPLKSPLNYHAV